jgi:hypothetical protein
MLGVLKALVGCSRLERSSRLKLTTVPMPPPLPDERCTDQENPYLNDEDLLARLEARLDKETGADLMNMQTFGACSGWSFEEALAANEKLRTVSAGTEGEDSTISGGSCSQVADVEASEREEDSDASEGRNCVPLTDKWTWEISSQQAKRLDNHRKSSQVLQQQAVHAALPPFQ